MKLGEFELHLVSDGRFKLDGGAMFGIIPKVLWQKSNPADDNNRINLGLHCLVIKTASDLIVVDTGIGDNYTEKFARIFAVDKSTDLLTGLQEIGWRPEDVTKVILTHLHFDHCGGNCLVSKDGTVLPTFPNATYYFNRLEYDYARNPDVRSKASYLAHNWEAVAASGRLVLTANHTEIVPGILTLVTGGHTENHQIVKVTSRGETACFLADLVPTDSHLKIPYVMGYDLFPKTTMVMKERILQTALAEQWLLLFEHTPSACAGYLIEDEGRLRLNKIAI
jgi:glyoxylase-like metal-dependent hydrolase (beta-lactamase superfamily II)